LNTNNYENVYVRDLVKNTTQLVSVNGTGTAAGTATSGDPVISNDGRYVAFASLARDLGPTDNNNFTDLYVRDLVAGTTSLVSINAAGTATGNSTSDSPVMSGDGRYVAFESAASDLVSGDTNNTWDVFVRDLVAGTTTLVSVNAAGTGTGNAQSVYPAMTSDGRYVAFQSNATNLTADSVTRRNIFLRDLVAGTTTLVSPGDNDNSAGVDKNFALAPMISADGQQVAFMANSSSLVPGDYNGFSDVFLWSNDVPPVANAGGPYAVNEGGNVVLDGTGSSDPDGSITLYEWDFSYDGTTFHADATGATPTLSASGLDGASTQTIALRVTDEQGQQSTIATTSLTINEVAPAVTAPANQ